MKHFNLAMSDEEWDYVKAKAEAEKVTFTQVIRVAICRNERQESREELDDRVQALESRIRGLEATGFAGLFRRVEALERLSHRSEAV